MRDYGTVASQFWVRGTGKELRGDMEAQIVALYLMTSPHANMIGVFHLPVMYLAHETGLTLEAAKSALDRLAAKDFCTYEEESEWIFVHRFAANQIGEELKEGDKRIKGVLNELSKVPAGACLRAFTFRYAAPFHLGESPSEAPSEPLRSQNRTEQKQKQSPSAAKSRQTSMPEGFDVSERVRVWAESKRIRESEVRAGFEAFVSYCRRKGAKYTDWDEALMTAIREDWAKVRGKGGGGDDWTGGAK